MRVQGLHGLTEEELVRELSNGAKFVIFEYTISLLIVTFKRPTDIYFIRSNESAVGKSMPYTLLTFFVGWWGIPGGIIYTPMSLATNLSGGKNVTQEVLAMEKGIPELRSIRNRAQREARTEQEPAV